MYLDSLKNIDKIGKQLLDSWDNWANDCNKDHQRLQQWSSAGKVRTLRRPLRLSCVRDRWEEAEDRMARETAGAGCLVVLTEPWLARH